MQVPATRPAIKMRDFEAAYKLQKENRPRVEIRQGADETILIPSTGGMAEYGTRQTVAALADLYSHLTTPEDEAPFESWEQYKQIRSKFHIIKRSKIWTGLKNNILKIVKYF